VAERSPTTRRLLESQGQAAHEAVQDFFGSVSQMTPGGKLEQDVGASGDQATAAARINGMPNGAAKTKAAAILQGKQPLPQGANDIHEYLDAIGVPQATGPTAAAFPRQGGGWASFGKVLTDKNATAADVADFARDLNSINGDAFPALVRNRMQSGLPTNRVPTVEEYGSWAEQHAGQPGTPQRDKFLETIKQVGIAKGMSEADAAVAAMEAAKRMDAIQSIGKGQPSPQGKPDIAGPGFFSSLAQGFDLFKPGTYPGVKQVASAFDSIAQRAALKQVEAGLDNPRTLLAASAASQANPVARALGIGVKQGAKVAGYGAALEAQQGAAKKQKPPNIPDDQELHEAQTYY
jgi:hypothetical protein